MIIRTDDIKDEGLFLEFQESPERFPVLEEITRTGECGFFAPLGFHLRAIRVKSLIEVEGQFSTTAHHTCSRCLKEFDKPMSSRFALTYTRKAPEIPDEASKEDIELREEEIGLIPFQGREIDLRDGLQEQVVLAIPIKPLCSLSCKGLCLQCGADLNRGDCGCQKVVFDPRLAALRDWKGGRK